LRISFFQGRFVKSIRQAAEQPAGRPLIADDLLEFHASRLLLLCMYCGKRNRIEGLTKLAKLDFFVRYPQFFDQAAAHQGGEERSAARSVESSMVRHHYGPWDKRYYRVLPYLESCGLLDVQKKKNTYEFQLTVDGVAAAKQLAASTAFAELIEQMKQVKAMFGDQAGSTLKRLIYEVFDQEVAQKSLGEVIK
jgi:hypothetical protein